MKDRPVNNREIEEVKDNSLSDSRLDRGSRSDFIYKKTEKLVAALYMITDFIKDIEPLKWQLRGRSLNLVSVRAGFLNSSASKREELLREYRSIWNEIISLSEIARYNQLVSEMNHSVLKREFEKLMSVLEDEDGEYGGQNRLILHPEFFEKTPEIRADRKKEENVLYEHKPVVSKGHDQKMVVTDRKVIITKLLSKKGNLSIKDFSQAIKGCSEKTIQRELLAMVAAGTVKKQGERRWSTYSLAF